VLDADNAMFSISGNILSAVSTFDFETKSEYNINIKVSDSEGNSFTKAFVINVNDVFENQNPISISLSNTNIPENAQEGVFLATISAIDNNISEEFTFELFELEGKISTHNDMFKVIGNELFTAQIFDYETLSQLYICIKVTDKYSGIFVQEFTINVTDIDENNRPTDIILSKINVYKNAQLNSIVTDISAVDEDENDEHKFRLYPANGILDADNDKFIVEDNNLRLNADISNLSGYLYINLRTIDKSEGIYTKAFKLKVDDLCNVITNILLTNDNIAEDAALGSLIGDFSAIDNDESYIPVFEFVSGGVDNASFIIDCSSLKLNTILDFETKSSYSIKVKAIDQNGGSFEKDFVVNVKNVEENHAPKGIDITSNSIAEDAALGSFVGDFSAIDNDERDIHVFKFVSGGVDNASFIIDGSSLKLNTVLDFESKSSYSIKVKAIDQNGGSFVKDFTINVTFSTGIDIIQDVECKLYPNPVSNELNVKCKGVKTIKVYNAIGKLVLIHNNSSLQIDIKLNFSDQKEGLYFINIELDNKKIILKKVVK